MYNARDSLHSNIGNAVLNVHHLANEMATDPNQLSSMNIPATFNDYSPSLEELDWSSQLFALDYDAAFDMSLWMPDIDVIDGQRYGVPNTATNYQQRLLNPFVAKHFEADTSFQLGSRLPSLQPGGQEERANMPVLPKEASIASPCWAISSQDYGHIQAQLAENSSILPVEFILLPRHTLSRFLEGYFTGFHGHLPFLHLPTFSIRSCSLELMLAMAGVGAQYRFESRRGYSLLEGAKAIALERIRSRSDDPAWLSTPNPVPPCPLEATGFGFLPSAGNTPVVNSESHNTTFRPKNIDGNTLDDADSRLQLIQVLLLVMAMGTWGTKTHLAEALSMQSILNMQVREDGLFNMDNIRQSTRSDTPEAQTRAEKSLPDWKDWIYMETRKRTKLWVYGIFNLQCVAYNLPPLILNSEIKCQLPCSAKEWMADSAQQWAKQWTVIHDSDEEALSFQDGFAGLFNGQHSVDKHAPVSSFGNYILILAMLQHIFFVCQTSKALDAALGEAYGNLKSDDVDLLSKALRAWQAEWKRAPESSLEPLSPIGPMSFNSTALLRIAWIRLHSNLGPCRNLESRDPAHIAASFKAYPSIRRSPRLSGAILQAAHTLSIPVRIGINFVAKTQTYTWSMQHALCNLECAFLLSKWLESIAMTHKNQQLSTEENGLLEMVKRMLDETEFSVSGEYFEDGNAKDRGIMMLGAAAVRLWATAFRGTHVFEIATVIGRSLEIYADLLERDLGFAQ
jgi:hypothetical protein